MFGVAEEKVEGGKLVRVKVEFIDKLNRVQITGDFFLHPEENLKDIEEGLLDTSIEATEQEIIDKIKAVVSLKNITMIGITAEVIARLIKKITQDEMETD